MADLHDVAVVVVTYNSASHVLQALRALPLTSLRGVVVIDNASTDRTPDLVESAGLPNVRVIRQTNVGFGGGCNTGASAFPDAPHLLFLNPDAMLAEDDLRRLQAHLLSQPSAALVGPRLWRDHEPLTSAGRIAMLRTELKFALPPLLGRWFPDRRLPASLDRSGPVGMVEGACMLADAQAWRAVGGFDERYFLFFEEHDLARRLAAAGREVHLCAEARAQHAVGTSREGTPLAGHDHYWRSATQYLELWGPPGGAFLLRLAARTGWRWARLRGRLTREDAHRLRRALSRPLGPLA